MLLEFAQLSPSRNLSSLESEKEKINEERTRSNKRNKRKKITSSRWLLLVCIFLSYKIIGIFVDRNNYTVYNVYIQR